MSLARLTKAATLQLAVQALSQSKLTEAESVLKPLVSAKTPISPYASWYLGQTYIESKKWKEAVFSLEAVTRSKVSRELILHASYDLARAYDGQGQSKKAEKLLLQLERKSRSYAFYQDVLYRLIALDQRKKPSVRMCRRAELLYSKFPNHPLVVSWGSDLAAVKVGGRPLKCQTSLETKQRRLRFLQLNGLEDQARKELAMILENLSDSVAKITIQAEFLIQVGQPVEATDLLVPILKDNKGNISYLKLLAKAAARAEKVDIATYAYKLLAEKSVRDALFNAAILQYQHQNYDLAAQLLDQHMQKGRSSRSQRQAEEWYSAWIQYLRADYEKAIKGFEEIKRHRYSNQSAIQRATYWHGRSLIKAGKPQPGIRLLQEVSSENGLSFYQIAAEQHLKAIGVQTRLAPAEARKIAAEVDAQVVENSEVELESEEKVDAVESTEAEDTEEEQNVLTTFKDLRLQMKFDTAKLLISHGMPTLATWELREIERLTANPEYLTTLMQLYDELGAVNRSAYIAEINFARKRYQGGFDGAKNLWQSSYPQAYAVQMNKALAKFSVPTYLPWSIMRAESFYRSDARSPVGAMGLMQIMPYTAARLVQLSGAAIEPEAQFAPDHLLQPETAIELGTLYLSRLNRIFSGEIPLVAAAYNAGPHRVQGWLKSFGDLNIDEFIEHIPFLETREYVKKVSRNYAIYKGLYGSQSKSVQDLRVIGSIGAQWTKPTPFQEDWSND